MKEELVRGMKPVFSIPLSHYYGNIVRRLFLATAIIMAVGLPFYGDRIPIPAFVSLLLIVLLAFFAGLTNPVKAWTAAINSVVSLIAAVGFEAYAITAYRSDYGVDLFFWLNQGLAVIFLVALYYSTKTFRAMALES